jgi:hypothetical protein
MRASNAGVVALLNPLAWPLVGDPDRESGVGGSLGTTTLPSMLSLAGDLGESTVTMGGERCEGVTSIMLCGRAGGGLGLGFLGPGCSTPLPAATWLLFGASPEDVRGRSAMPLAGEVSDTCRAPPIGGVAFCSASLPRFSKRDRRDETGLIDVESVGLSGSAMLLLRLLCLILGRQP